VIHESLYHRTCFRCARCSSVLTLGNFYETEKDHEFCCETCPDEEKKPEESNRLSIAQKIALFEKDSSTSVLKKSLSDEEKSKSLSRQKPAHSDALNGFLAAQITTEQEASEEDEKTIDSLSSDSDSEDEAETAIKPPLPAEKPPIDEKPLISGKPHLAISDHKVISETPENFVVTKELTHDKDTEAIASVAETHPESQEQVAHVVVKKVPEDDIESLFEQLAEDAVATSFAPMPVVTKKVSVPPAQKVQQTQVTVEEKPKVAELTRIEDEKTEMETDESEVAAVEEQAKLEEEKTAEVKSDSIEETPLPAIDEPEKTDKNEETYPDNLDPFGDEGEEEPEVKKPENPKKPSLNPFGDCSDDEEEVQETKPARSYGTLPKPPRPPPPKAVIKPVSTNPFGSDDDDDEPEQLPVRTPVPTPRKPLL
jgi:hypothetical protein